MASTLFLNKAELTAHPRLETILFWKFWVPHLVASEHCKLFDWDFDRLCHCAKLLAALIKAFFNIQCVPLKIQKTDVTILKYVTIFKMQRIKMIDKVSKFSDQM